MMQIGNWTNAARATGARRNDGLEGGRHIDGRGCKGVDRIDEDKDVECRIECFCQAIMFGAVEM
jgi:hypothetical protein